MPERKLIHWELAVLALGDKLASQQVALLSMATKLQHCRHVLTEVSPGERTQHCLFSMDWQLLCLPCLLVEQESLWCPVVCESHVYQLFDEGWVQLRATILLLQVICHKHNQNLITSYCKKHWKIYTSTKSCSCEKTANVYAIYLILISLHLQIHDNGYH